MIDNKLLAYVYHFFENSQPFDIEMVGEFPETYSEHPDNYMNENYRTIIASGNGWRLMVQGGSYVNGSWAYHTFYVTSHVLFEEVKYLNVSTLPRCEAVWQIVEHYGYTLAHRYCAGWGIKLGDYDLPRRTQEDVSCSPREFFLKEFSRVETEKRNLDKYVSSMKEYFELM